MNVTATTNIAGIIALLCLIFGVLCLLAGFGIVTIKQFIEIKPGRGAIFAGFVFTTIGIFLLIPEVRTSLFPPTTSTATSTASENTQVATTLTVQNVATPSSNLIHNETISPEALARIVGGDAKYWTQAGPVVWVYSNKGNNTLMLHPGDNMILTYWAGFGDPQNAHDCQIIVPQADNLAKYVKCPSVTRAEIVADQVGLHLIDYTGYFP